MGKKKKPAAYPTQARVSLKAEVVVAAAAAVGIARPRITAPGEGFVPPGVDLLVTVNTNRSDLSYITRLTDLTPPAAGAVDAPVPAPGVAIFNVTIPGALLVADHEYEILVIVDPAVGLTPPHRPAFVDVNTNTPVGPMSMMEAPV